ncbi:hypothetical protein HHUSO_G21425, partial [Huso huso]
SLSSFLLKNLDSPGHLIQISFMIGLTPGQCSGTSPVQYLENGISLNQPTIRKMAKDFSTTQAANYIAVSPEQEKKCSEFRILREPTEGWDLNPGQQQRAMTGAEWLGGKLEQTLQGGGCVVFYTTNSPCLKKCFSDMCERKIDIPLSQEPFSQWNIENKVHKYFTYTQLYLNDDSAQVQAGFTNLRTLGFTIEKCSYELQLSCLRCKGKTPCDECWNKITVCNNCNDRMSNCQSCKSAEYKKACGDCAVFEQDCPNCTKIPQDKLLKCNNCQNRRRTCNVCRERVYCGDCTAQRRDCLECEKALELKCSGCRNRHLDCYNCLSQRIDCKVES